jgi:branched-chain amino acid transport system substrate-binding protein
MRAPLKDMIERLETVGTETAIFIALPAELAVRFVYSIKEAGLTNLIFLPDALASHAFATGFDAYPKEKINTGYYTEGIHAVTPMLFDVRGIAQQQFYENYENAYDEEPSWRPAFAYDAARVLVTAMQDASVTGATATVKEARVAIRRFLSNLDQAEDAIPGVTGLTYFDANGDPVKPVSVGIYNDRRLTSAFSQLMFVAGYHEFTKRRSEYDPSRVVVVDGKDMYKTDVVYAGIRATELEDVDTDELTFSMDFYIWFRYEGDTDVADIEFVNAVTPVSIGAPLDKIVHDGMTYELYRVNGQFSADVFPAPYGQHVLSMSFRHRRLTQNNLMYALDVQGMQEKRDQTIQQRISRAQRLLDSSSGWIINSFFFFQDIEETHAIGHPEYLTGNNKSISYSRFNLGVQIQRPLYSIRGLLTSGFANGVFAVSFISLLILIIAERREVTHRFSKAIWLPQSIFTLLLLLSAEASLGNWLTQHSPRHYLDLLKLLFDILWWFVPAFLLTVAVERFIWWPLEERTGQSVPTLLRHFALFTIFILAFFGIIAFVFDQKLTSLLATSGVIAMIIGLAVQINISNIFSGIALNMERPFRIGDWIQVHGRSPSPDDSVIGSVTDIGWRTTRLETADNTVVIIPNSVISERTVTNFMLPDESSRFVERFYVDQSAPIDKVIAVITEAVNSVVGQPGGLLAEPEFKVRVSDTTPMGIEYEVRYYIVPRDVSPLKARHTLNKCVLEYLTKAGIALSYPKQELLSRGAIRLGNDED